MSGGFHPTILRCDSIDSTNLEVMRQAKAGTREGLCIVAREQTEGRGRLDRVWHSHKDAGLYFSVLLRPDFEMTRWPLISLAAALAVSDAITRTCGLRVDIKWPNDICVHGRKLCGILAERIETEAGAAAVVGIGINLNEYGLPSGLKSQAISLEAAAGTNVHGDQLLHELLNALAERYELLRSQEGAEHTIREWCLNSSYAYDRRVRVTMNDEVIEGATRGLESDGALRVQTDNGIIRTIRAGDVTAVRPVN